MPYEGIFGGITALLPEHFKKMNGFSNDYWGWGGEDDDFAYRCPLLSFRVNFIANLHRVGYQNYKVVRNSTEIARYKMIKHERESSNPVNEWGFSNIFIVFWI